VGPDLLLFLRLETYVLQPLRLVGASLDEPDGGKDEERELEELRLPVLHDGAAEVGGKDVTPPRDRVLAVCLLLGVVGVLSGERLADERHQEDPDEEETEPVLFGVGPHPCVSATAR
jgi:hypothetical protein